MPPLIENSDGAASQARTQDSVEAPRVGGGREGGWGPKIAP